MHLNKILKLFLFLALAISPISLAHAQAPSPMISQQQVRIFTHGNPAHVATDADAKFAAALTTTTNSDVIAAITAARADVATQIAAFVTAATPAIVVSYAWTISTNEAGVTVVKVTGANAVRADTSFIP